MAVAEGAVAIIDVRPWEQRAAPDGGEIAGAVVVCRSVLEWRLDPLSPTRMPAVDESWRERTIVVVCREGFSSSLAAESLQAIGLAGATDLVGGFAAWRAAGLPTVPAGTNPQFLHLPR